MKEKENYWRYMNLQKVRIYPKNKKEEVVEYKKEIQVDRKTREYISKYDCIK